MRSLTPSLVLSIASLAVRLAVLLLAIGLLGSVTSCTINEVVLYKTSNYPAVQITPSAKIGPS